MTNTSEMDAALLDEYGVDAVYRPKTGASVAIKVIAGNVATAREDLSTPGDKGLISDRSISIPISAISNPAIDEVVIINGTDWQIYQILGIDEGMTEVQCMNVKPLIKQHKTREKRITR